jgi:hypothetical protein
LCQQALADDPPAAAQSAATTTAATTTAAPTTAEPSATSAAGGKSAAPGAEQKAAPEAESPTLKPGVTVVGAKQDLSPEDKELIARGYKLEMRQGEKYFCRREQQLGSRFETKVCESAQSIQAHRVESQEAVRTIQNDRPLINH